MQTISLLFLCFRNIAPPGSVAGTAEVVLDAIVEVFSLNLCASLLAWAMFLLSTYCWAPITTVSLPFSLLIRSMASHNSSHTTSDKTLAMGK